MTTQAGADEAVEQPLVPGAFKIIQGTALKATMAEHGRQVLTGTVPVGYQFQPIDLAYRAEVGKRVDGDGLIKHKVGARIMRAAAIALTEFGGLEWRKMNLAQREVELGKLRVGDLMYLAYVRLAGERGGKMRRPIGFEKCPHCKGPVPRHVDVDLTTMHIEGWDKEPLADYMLLEPWTLGGEEVHTVTLTAPRLSRALAPLTDDNFEDDLERNLIWLSAAIVRVNGHDRMVTPEDLTARPDSGRSLSNPDFDELVELMTQLTAGPALAVVWPCPECEGAIPVSIDWGHGFFVPSGA